MIINFVVFLLGRLLHKLFLKYTGLGFIGEPLGVVELWICALNANGRVKVAPGFNELIHVEIEIATIIVNVSVTFPVLLANTYGCSKRIHGLKLLIILEVIGQAEIVVVRGDGFVERFLDRVVEVCSCLRIILVLEV